MSEGPKGNEGVPRKGIPAFGHKCVTPLRVHVRVTPLRVHVRVTPLRVHARVKGEQ